MLLLLDRPYSASSRHGSATRPSEIYPMERCIAAGVMLRRAPVLATPSWVVRFTIFQTRAAMCLIVFCGAPDPASQNWV